MFRKRRLTANLMFLSIIPLLIFGLLVTLITSIVIYISQSREVEYSLDILVHSTYHNFELTYPGAFQLIDDRLYKGGIDLSEMNQAVDDIKEMSGADVTVFKGNQRYLTTVMTKDGQRAVHTKAASEVSKAVLQRGESYFSDDVMVNGTKYFGYYLPLQDAKGKVVGMLFAGKPSTQVIGNIERNILLVCIIALLIMVISVGIAMIYSKKIIFSLNQIKAFLGKTANGDLTAELDQDLMKRQDEVGEMGRFALMLQHSVSDLVGKDPLTSLHNRRSCNIVLQSLLEKSKKEDAGFAIAMGDIDLFKHINDTYGHQAGDQVLKQLALIMSEFMEHRGFVFRWGGEEFLLIFEDMDAKQAYEELVLLQKVIMDTSIRWKDESLQISITFGISDSRQGKDMEKLIQSADSYLYLGKKEGRNCIIFGQHEI